MIVISFISFQMISFLVDGYRGEIKELKLSEYLVFATFFPKLTSGPIVKYNSFNKSSKNNDIWEDLSSGMFLFIMGLGKKVILADTLEPAVNYAYSNLESMDTCSMLLVSLMYTLQIYFDFSGYSDMAMGIGGMFGYRLPANFNSPYKASNIAEFWERWHITLTNFFTQYLYVPMGGSRKGNARTYFNVILVFLCSGIWHGASWSFILWGLIHGILMVLYRLLKKPLSKIHHNISVLITFIIVNFTWIIFRAGSFQQLKRAFFALLNFKGLFVHTELADSFHYSGIVFLTGGRVPSQIMMWGFLLLCISIIFFLPNTQEIYLRKIRQSKIMALFCILITVISVMSLSNVTNYIYAMF